MVVYEIERERERCYHIKLDVTLADSVCQILNFGLEPDCVPRNMSYPVHSNFPRDWPRFTAQTTDVFTLLILGCTLQLHTQIKLNKYVLIGYFFVSKYYSGCFKREIFFILVKNYRLNPEAFLINSKLFNNI